LPVLQKPYFCIKLKTFKKQKMKKITLLAAVAIAVLATSCTKDHTCTCTTAISGGGTSSYVVTYHKSHKKNAQLLCDAEATQTNYTAPTSSTGNSTTCTFK
jgi:hypothetical protein